jgi:hypothetical protein
MGEGRRRKGKGTGGGKESGEEQVNIEGKKERKREKTVEEGGRRDGNTWKALWPRMFRTIKVVISFPFFP